MLDAVTGWAVGDLGTILRWDGVSWSSAGSPTSNRLNAVHCLSASSCWAVGNSGTILKWNGTAWSATASPVVNRLNAVEARSPAEAWIAGDNGTILEWDGASWTPFSSPITRHLFGITAEAPTDGWIVGRIGTILKDPPAYVPSGTYASRILDTDSATSTFMTVFWNEALPAGTTLTLASRTGDTAVPDGSWSAWSAEYAAATGTAVVSPSARYLQVRASLSTSDTSVTPELEDFTITYK
jgi:hypothetical protein